LTPYQTPQVKAMHMAIANEMPIARDVVLIGSRELSATSGIVNVVVVVVVEVDVIGSK